MKKRSAEQQIAALTKRIAALETRVRLLQDQVALLALRPLFPLPPEQCLGTAAPLPTLPVFTCS